MTSAFIKTTLILIVMLSAFSFTYQFIFVATPLLIDFKSTKVEIIDSLTYFNGIKNSINQYSNKLKIPNRFFRFTSQSYFNIISGHTSSSSISPSYTINSASSTVDKSNIQFSSASSTMEKSSIPINSVSSTINKSNIQINSEQKSSVNSEDHELQDKKSTESHSDRTDYPDINQYSYVNDDKLMSIPIFADNSHIDDIYETYTKTFKKPRISVSVSDDDKPLLLLGTYIPDYEDIDNVTKKALLKVHKFIITSYLRFKPQVSLTVFTKNSEILEFCNQHTINTITYYATNHYGSGYLHSILRLLEEKSAFFYGYVDPFLLYHSSLLKALMYINTLIERGFINDKTFIIGKYYSSDLSIDDIVTFMNEYTFEDQSIDSIIEKNSLLTDQYLSIATGSFFYTSHTINHSHSIPVVINHRKDKEALLNEVSKVKDCTLIDMSDSIPSYMFQDIQYISSMKNKVKDKGWNDQKTKGSFTCGSINNLQYKLLLDSDFGLHLYMSPDFDTFVYAPKEHNLIMNYLPQHPRCLYYTHSFANTTQFNFCESLSIYYYDKISNAQLNSKFKNKIDSNIDETVSSVNMNTINTRGICKHYTSYMYQPFKDSINMNKPFYNTIFINTVCPLHLLQFISNRIDPSTIIFLKGIDLWKARGYINTIKASYTIIDILHADYMYSSKGYFGYVVLKPIEENTKLISLPL